MMKIDEHDVFAAITDFLSSDPSDEELLAYKLPDDLQERLGQLLYLNRESELTCEQRHELDDYMRANRMITKLKLKKELRMRGLE